MSSTRPVTLVAPVDLEQDACAPQERSTKWRPTAALVEHFRPARVDLLYPPGAHALAAQVAEDVRALVPAALITLDALPPEEADFATTIAAFGRWAARRGYDAEAEDVLVNGEPLSDAQRLCLFFLIESGELPGRLVAAPRPETGEPAQIIDLRARLRALGETHPRVDTPAREDEHVALDEAAPELDIPVYNVDFALLLDRIESVATRCRTPILLVGPDGTGKVALARRVYAAKKACGLVTGAFVEFDCSTWFDDEVIGELFGQVPGDPGAEDRCVLRQAEGGVLCLREVGALPRDAQAILQAVIERGVVPRLFADGGMACDVQLVCCNREDPRDAVEAGTLRESLLACIDRWWFHVPALKDRPEDIAANIDYELARNERALGVPLTFVPAARARYLEFALEAPWPGNFYELEGSIERMAVHSRDGLLTERVVDEEIAELLSRWVGRVPVNAPWG